MCCVTRRSMKAMSSGEFFKMPVLIFFKAAWKLSRTCWCVYCVAVLIVLFSCECGRLNLPSLTRRDLIGTESRTQALIFIKISASQIQQKYTVAFGCLHLS